MTDYGLYDTIPSTEEQRIKTLLYNNFVLTLPLNLEEGVENDYCTLNFDIPNDASEEYIVKSFHVGLTDEVFRHQNCYLQLKYYDLNTGDLSDAYEYDTLKTEEFILTEGDNEIVLNEDTPCYLLKDFKLIIKGTPCERFKRLFADCIE